MSNSLNKKMVTALFFCLISLYGNAQSGHEITINLKNCKDTLAYLTYYQFDKSYVKDTCTNIKGGKIVFKGKDKLDKGVYTLVSQQKSIYFDFFIDDDSQFLKLKGDIYSYPPEIVAENSDRVNDFFKYIRFLGEQNKTFLESKQKLAGLSKADSLTKITSSQKTFEKTIREYETGFFEKNKGSYLATALNLKIEKVLQDIPNASNGRPDSLKVYHYYKSHYWDGVDFKDDAIMRNPFFANKLKKYFESVVVIHPDSVSVEIDRLMQKTNQSSLLNKIMLAHFTSTYENSKIMGMEKVFVHIVDLYFKTGKAVGTYEEETIGKIIKRADLLRPLLSGAPAPDLMMINASDRDKILKMGFENAKSSEEITNLFYSNKPELDKLFSNIY